MDQPELTGSGRTAVPDHRVCFARYISSLKDQRVAASKVLTGPQAQPAGDKAEFVEKVRRALYLGKSFLMLRASPSCVLHLMNTTGI
jgi:6-phosphogluconate dehydrogenase